MISSISVQRYKRQKPSSREDCLEWVYNNIHVYKSKSASETKTKMKKPEERKKERKKEGKKEKNVGSASMAIDASSLDPLLYCPLFCFDRSSAPLGLEMQV